MEAQAKTPAAQPPRPARRRPRPARATRYLARAPRYAFVAFAVVTVLAGVRAIFFPASEGARAGLMAPRVDYAEQSFALGFARAYLTYDAAHPQEREEALAAFGHPGLEGGAGFTPPGVGSQSVRWADVAQVQRPLAGGELVVVAAQLSDSSPVYLSVPVDREPGGAIYLSSYPAFVGPPLTSASAPPAPSGEPVSEGEVQALVKRALANYLGDDAEDLGADLADAATVTLPSNPLALRDVEQLDWVSGRGGGAVLATVSATDPRGGAYTLRYEVGVRRVGAADPQLGPGWRVTFIQAISQES